MKKLLFFLCVLSSAIMLSCQNDRELLPSAEERRAKATQELVNELTSPKDGWRINYRPTSGAGTFLILLQFNEDRTVRIQSDVTADDGAYLDQTIGYRIDNELETELIFETYAVFHYLFELNQNTFGGEYEMFYKGKTGDNLIFRSKTDVPGNTTTLTFIPAGAADASLISTTIIGQLAQGSYRQGDLLGIPPNTIYQFYYPEDNLSIYALIDVNSRLAQIQGAAIGQSTEEIINSAEKTNINTIVELSFLSEKVNFDRPVSFQIAGKSYSISGFTNSNFSKVDTTYCDGGSAIPFVTFDSEVGELSDVKMSSSLFASHSTFFDQENALFIIDPRFLIDDNDSSLAEKIDKNIKDVAAFVLLNNSSFNGFTGDGTFTGMGFAVFDEDGNISWYMREMNIVQQSGNFVELELTDGTFINVADSLDERDFLFEITDEIFTGGKIYGFEVQGLEDLYEIYNPCNGYKLFLNEL